jgi:D-alanyl-D-alanine carboxypeptidase/D-alanyl-D-alanine-endopeptidase (penicillin-binding protein 4)
MQALRLFLVIALGGPLFPTIHLQAQSSYTAILREWIDDDYFRHASVGVSLRAVEDGREIAGYADQRSLIPASNLKLLTTATALAMLGPDFRYQTQVAYDGSIDARGVLQGNLYLIGAGDPSLASPELEGTPDLGSLLERFSVAVQRAGIRRIAGRIIADDSAFRTAATGSHWQWLDMGNYYGCGTFGLNAHENLYYLRFQQNTTLGSIPAVAQVTPTIPGLQFVNEVRSAERGSGDNAYIYGAPYTYLRYLRGTIPVGGGRFTIKGAIPDPPLFLAQQLQATLETKGIISERPPASQHRLDAPAAQREVIYTHESLPLTALVTRTNMKSVNLYAEALLRTIGREFGKEGSAPAGLEALQAYWTAQGLNFAGVQLYDGSGMAPRNVLPAAFLTKLLRLAWADERIQTAFWESLPVAGRSGSMRNQLRELNGRVRAKSGSLEQVRAYSGYLTARSGQTYAFSVLVNNYEGSGAAARRKIMDLLAKWGAL